MHSILREIMNRQSLNFLQKFNGDFWKELEINYPRVEELVRSNLRDQCKELSGIREIGVEIICAYVDEPYSRPKIDTLERIGNIDQTPINVMLALREFMKRKDDKTIVSYFNVLKHSDVHADVVKYYNDIKARPRGNLRYERLLLLLLFYKHKTDEPHVLKQIMALNSVSSANTPRYKQTKGITIDKYLLERRMDGILKRLKEKDRKNMEYVRFCDFEKDDVTYCFIKRQKADKIDRQIKINIRSKPAEFLLFMFLSKGEELQMKSSRPWLAENAIDVIQEKILSGDAKFERIIPPISISNFRNLPRMVLREGNKLKLLDIEIEGSPFRGAPSARFWSNSGINECLSELKDMGFDLLDPKYLKKITVNFKGNRSIYFDMENMTVPEYDNKGLNSNEQTKFEELVENEFGFPVIPRGP